MTLPAVSFEFFPPRNLDQSFRLWDTARALAPLGPDFVSVTYGAGGTTRKLTHEAVTALSNHYGLNVAAHLTCVDASREETMQIVDEYAAAGVREIVALRGDAPQGQAEWTAHPEGFASSVELIEAIAKRGDIAIRVGAYPEPHPDSPGHAADVAFLKRKVDAGATRALTQFFFDNDQFERYMTAVRAAGVTIPVLPGIMPIQNLTQLKRFAGRCGTSIPAFLDERFAGTDDDAARRFDVAADVAAEQIADLVRRGVNDFHLYTMNRAPLTNAVLSRLGLARKDAKAA